MDVGRVWRQDKTLVGKPNVLQHLPGLKMESVSFILSEAEEGFLESIFFHSSNDPSVRVVYSYVPTSAHVDKSYKDLL